MKPAIKLTLDMVLAAKNMTRYELAKRTGSQFPTIDSYYKNKVQRYDSDLLLRICVALDCDIEDIISIEK